MFNKSIKLTIAALLCGILNSSISFAQSSGYLASDFSLKSYKIESVATDSSSKFSTEDTLYIKKRFWRASGELMLSQIIPWAYNYYVRDAEFAHVSWESIKYNLDFSHWEWDDNSFQTNQFAHPYQGNMYYSSFRTNGYSFWQSAPAAFVGSYMWEVAGETHPAAPNDLLNTGLGGISLGEMTYRISNLIVNNRQVGFKRQVNEVLAFLVNPMNGLNRIIDGRWGRFMPNIPDRMPGSLSGNLDLGYRRVSEEVNKIFTKGDNEFYVRAGIQYGDPFADLEKPFSNFYLIGELGASDSATLNNLNVSGLLYGKHLNETDKIDKVLAVTMNYDYIKNTSIQFGSQSFNLKIMHDRRYQNNSAFITEYGIIGVAIAAVPDDYLSYGEGRNYDFGPGAGFLLGAKYDHKHKFALSLNYKGVWFVTANGNDADFYINVFNADARYFISPSFSAVLSGGYFRQDSNYEDFEDVIKKYPFGRIGIGYTIGASNRN